jgi:hypothetical protein
MVLQTSGSAIKFSEIQDEFGGTNPISLSEYYIGGDNVPATITSSGVAPGAFTAYTGGGVFVLPFVFGPITHFKQVITKSFTFTEGGSGSSFLSTLLASNPTYTYTLAFDAADLLASSAILTSASTNGTALFPGSVNGGATNSVTYKAAYEASLNAANEVIITSGGFDYQIGSNVFASRITPILFSAGTTAEVIASDFSQVRRRTTGTQVTSNVNPNVPANGEVSISDYYGGRDD